MLPSWIFVIFILALDLTSVKGKSDKLLIAQTPPNLDPSENKDNLKADGDDNKDSGGEAGSDEQTTRSLQAGDIFTPLEMLPVAFKLLKKVETIGEGKGIVSSAKSPEDLADRLFESFFMSSKRIVYLTEKDISGLDALQALALAGETVVIRSSLREKEDPVQILKYEGQLIERVAGPKKCRYKLIAKNVKQKNPPTDMRRGDLILKVEKNMSPNRHLIVKHEPAAGAETAERKKKNNATLQNANKNGVKRHKVKKVKHLRGRREFDLPLEVKNRTENENAYQVTVSPLKKGCKWRYNCKRPGNLDTCRLRTSCLTEGETETVIENNFASHLEDEDKPEVKAMRKMLGITLLDEDVEKIIEQHVLLVQPENMEARDKIETLEEYFHNVIMSQYSKMTTPMPIVNLDQEEEDPQFLEKASNEKKDNDQDQNSARRQENETVIVVDENVNKSILFAPKLQTTTVSRSTT